MKKLILILSIVLTNVLSAQDTISKTNGQDTTGNTYVTNNYNNDYSYSDNLRLFYGEDYWYYSMFTPIINWCYSPYWGWNYGWWNSWNWNNGWRCNYYGNNWGWNYRNYAYTHRFYGFVASRHIGVIQKTHSYSIRNYGKYNQNRPYNYNSRQNQYRNSYKPTTNYKNFGYHKTINYSNSNYRGSHSGHYSNYGGTGHSSGNGHSGRK